MGEHNTVQYCNVLAEQRDEFVAACEAAGFTILETDSRAEESLSRPGIVTVAVRADYDGNLGPDALRWDNETSARLTRVLNGYTAVRRGQRYTARD
jgi:hypothetical protein